MTPGGKTVKLCKFVQHVCDIWRPGARKGANKSRFGNFKYFPSNPKPTFQWPGLGMFRSIAPQKLVCFQKLLIFDPKTFKISKILKKFDDSRCKKHEISMFLVIFGVPGPESCQTNEFLKIPDSSPNKIFQGRPSR